ncbi:MAG TPA: hypothetical protein DCM40_34120 [Maribacter sp.]|nr:hypothetical protein [Maribacter sp.]|tara:strand:- start:811 stop:1098 length:288 start_codon:yes stop_codon:yes gene_type:complete
MSKPEFGNSKIKIVSNMNVDDHVTASCWLNVTDEDLANRMMEYFSDRNNSNINVVIQKRTGEGYNTTKVASFNLFVNTPKEETMEKKVNTNGLPD